MAFLSRAALLVAGALVVLAAAPAAGAGGSVCFDRVFSFGDSLTDTGNFLLSVPDDFPDPARNLPYGQTFFDRSSGRYSDGRNLLDFFDWMKTHHESDLAESDYGMRIDLITRVFGASATEDFFEKLPPGAKSIEAYTTLLHSYGRSKMTDKAERLFERMKDANLSMDALLYNEMTMLYISVRELDKVEIIAEELKRQNVNPDLFTYNLRVSAVAASMDLEGFKGILDEMSKDPNSKEGWTLYRNLGYEATSTCFKSTCESLASI